MLPSSPLVRMACILLAPLLLIVLLLSCGSPAPAEAPGGQPPSTGDPSAGVGDTWSGMLNVIDTGHGGSSRPVELVLTRERNAITGTLTFSQPVEVTESTLTGTLEGDHLRFQESQGRYVWGTISGDTLSGQVAWDGFEGTAYAQLDLIRGETTPSGSVRFLDLSDGDQVQLGTGRWAHRSSPRWTQPVSPPKGGSTCRRTACTWP